MPKCPPDCTCRRHVSYSVTCADDCTCGKHTFSAEHRQKMAEARRARPDSIKKREFLARAEPQLCACGCGEYAKVDERRNRVSKFVSGHNSRVSHPMQGKSHAPEAKKVISESTRDQMERQFPGASLRATLKRDHPGTYGSWRWMMSRCFASWNASYANYGGQGITVCQRWQTFENFLADMGDRPEGMSIDRIDGSGNYEPANCRWATKAEQNANRRNGWTKRRANQQRE